MLRCRISHRSLLAVLAGLLALASPGQALTPEWVERWGADLEAARTALEQRHPAPFHQTTRDEIAADFAALSRQLPELEHHEVIVELARIVARVGDGHTRLSLPLGPYVDFEQGHSSTPNPALGEMRFHQLPLRLEIDGEGPWVRRTVAEHRELLGARLVALDGRPITEVIAAVAPTVRRDNEMQLLHHLPMHLVLPELLHAVGVLGSPTTAMVTVRTLGGELATVRLAPLDFDHEPDWVTFETAGAAPLSEQGTDRNYWLTYLDERRTVYLQFNVVYDEPVESIRQLAGRLAALIEERSRTRPVERLILDLRRNRGGNGSLLQPLLHAVLSSPLNETGRLYVLIGRATFSAAMFMALDLEKHTEAIFVGEPTGARPNHYGDSRKVQLPNSGLTLRVSTLYWQSHPRDRRPWIAPQLPIAVTRDDVLAGRDPVLDTVLGLEPPPEGVAWRRNRSWAGELRTGSGAFPWTVELSPSPAGWTGTVDVPAFGLEAAQARELRLEPAGLSFSLQVREGPIRFHGLALGGRLYGTLDLGSNRSLFFLAPSAGSERRSG